MKLEQIRGGMRVRVVRECVVLPLTAASQLGSVGTITGASYINRPAVRVAFDDGHECWFDLEDLEALEP